MKLSELSLQDKIKLTAKLDGYAFIETINKGYFNLIRPSGMEIVVASTLKVCNQHCPNYMESYDAIIPLIQKLKLHNEVLDALGNAGHNGYSTEATPSQLLDALLIAYFSSITSSKQ